MCPYAMTWREQVKQHTGPAQSMSATLAVYLSDFKTQVSSAALTRAKLNEVYLPAMTHVK